MSNDVFPTLPGLKWGTVKTPMFSTRVLTAASQRETRGSFTSYPRWRITRSFEFLRNSNGHNELDTLVGFFNQRLGQLDNFLLRDENDHQVTDQALGMGDGARLEYRFVRSLGGFVEPVLAPDAMWVHMDRGAALGKWRVSHESRTNHLARTEDIGNSYWTKTGATVSGNTVAAPDAAADADTLTEDTSTGEHSILRSMVPPGGVGAKHIVSFYVKPDGRTQVSLFQGFLGSCSTLHELSGDGASSVLTNPGSLVAHGTRALSNGWYRIWLAFLPGDDASHSVRLRLANGAGAVTYTGDGSSGVHVAWAQLEVVDGDAPNEPSEYIPSTGSTATTVPAAFTEPDDFGYFSFAAPPPSGVEVSWSGTFYFRVRFTHDSTEFAEFMRDLYEARKVEFITEK